MNSTNVSRQLGTRSFERFQLFYGEILNITCPKLHLKFRPVVPPNYQYHLWAPLLFSSCSLAATQRVASKKASPHDALTNAKPTAINTSHAGDTSNMQWPFSFVIGCIIHGVLINGYASHSQANPPSDPKQGNISIQRTVPYPIQCNLIQLQLLNFNSAFKCKELKTICPGNICNRILTSTRQTPM